MGASSPGSQRSQKPHDSARLNRCCLIDTPNPVTGFDVAKDIKAPFLGLYGETDTNPTPADARKFVEMLKPHNPAAEAVVFPGAGHAFFADYRPSYNAAAAAEGWKRCLAHFDKHLKA